MRKWIILGVVVVVVILIDQISKTWIINNLELYETVQPIPALAPLFQITRSTNTGMAFGLLSDVGNAFLILIAVIVGAMLWYFRSTPANARFLPMVIGMVIGGALGNGIDRLQHGHVIDFIHYQIPDVISNVSNLADHGIVLGVFLLIGESLWREYREKQAEKASGSSDSTTGQSASADSTPLD